MHYSVAGDFGAAKTCRNIGRRDERLWILAGEIAVAQPMSSTQFVGADGVPQAPAVAAGHVPKRSLTCRGVEHTIEQTQPAYVNQMLVNMGYAPAPSQPSPTPSSSEVESSSFPAAPISAPSPAGARPLRYWQPPTADPDEEEESEYEESSVLGRICSSAWKMCREKKKMKIVQNQKKRCPLCSSSKYYF